MRVFVTGATGFIGSAVVDELLAHGHQVLGLSRSDAGAAALHAAGAQVHRGDLQDLEGLRQAAATADAVLHLGFNHDFSRFLDNCREDALVIQALAEALAGSQRPLVITSGVGMGARGEGTLASEDHFDADHQNPRIASEQAGLAASARGVDVRVVRLPQVHDTRKQGLISYAVSMAREKGASAYLGQGSNRYSAVHRLDAARVYRLALERGQAGQRYHAVDEEGVAFRDIAEAIGQVLHLPVVSLAPAQAGAHFGWMAAFAGMDLAASSALTRQRLGWQPEGPGLVEDLHHLELAQP